ncbi:MAG: hypothetical protein EOO50_07390 [Flavobacterium sp.]|uniref:hypothetical protein n=1 Tax=Flavobacterium sp. TaxID=239 RepID=UPI00121B18C6|nr:hypothetical protein [Flavobacterium sp.]RZJ67078.1 MAG: hypothetical protein EOO50_07390 [Flavobacterium sp.]
MKKFTFLFVLTLTSYFCQAQFQSQNPELLLNKEVRLTSLSPTLQKFSNKGADKAQTNATGKTFAHSAVVGKTFKVVEVAPYEKYGTTKFKLKLESAEHGTYYYDYDPKYNREFVLEIIGDLELTAK